MTERNGNGNGYGDESIKQLKGAERVRKRPGVMFGSDDINGAFHTVKEILANSLDEARAGFGNKVIVKYYADGSISVQDFGRGVPMGWNENEGRYNWDLIFNELYAGGKYEETGDYEFSLGLNGLGAAAVQYTSEFFHVVSKRYDKIYKKSFAKGYPLDDKLYEEPNTTGETGTFIHWKIDNEVFPDTNFTPRMFKEYLEIQAHLNSVDIEFHDERSGEVVLFHGEGVEPFLRSKLGNSLIDVLTRVVEKSGVENGKDYRAKAEIVLAITEETQGREFHYHNTANMRTGVHFSAFRDALSDFFKNVAKDRGVSITVSDYQDYLSVLTSTYSNVTSFANQTKEGVSNRFIYDLIHSTVLDMLEEALAMQKPSIIQLIENVVNAAIARLKAKEIEMQQRLALKAASGRRKEKPERYVDCKEKDPRKRELFIVEGDSAKGACKAARDGSFQALLSVKGKPMNGLKASLESLLENQEVKDIIATLGCGVDIEGLDGVNFFNEEDLQFERIIIATDADIDGYQIRVLLYTIFYRLMPKLLEKGYIYVAETPLFELEMSNGESWFAYDIYERDELLEKARKERLTVKKVNRSKGLGENDPDMLWQTTMNPETRRLVPLTIDIKDQIVRDISNMLFGQDENNERKHFVFQLLEAKLGEDASLIDLVDTVMALESERDQESAVEAS